MKKEKNEVEYIDIADYEDDRYPYQAFIGGRGTGKTYSALRFGVKEYLETGNKFILMRRTASEMEALCDSRIRGEGLNPFKSLNTDYDWNYGILPITKNMNGIYNRKLNPEKQMDEASGPPIGYATALSTIASIRGIDLTDASRLFYDEFIPERHVHKMRGEGDALLNAIETIGRNRELKGQSALKVYLLANAFDIYNEIFTALGIVDMVEKMVNSKEEHLYLPDRGLAVHLLKSTKSFMNEKKRTALYKLTKGTNFADMALENDFVYNDFSLIGWKNIKGYTPMCGVGDMYLWKKKGSRSVHICYAAARVVNYNPNFLQDRKSFKYTYGAELQKYFMKSMVTFETYNLKQRFLDIMGIK